MKIGGIHENSLQVKQERSLQIVDQITSQTIYYNNSSHLSKEKTVTVSVFRYLILISIDFYNFISPFSPQFKLRSHGDDTSNTQDSVFITTIPNNSRFVKYTPFCGVAYMHQGKLIGRRVANQIIVSSWSLHVKILTRFLRYWHIAMSESTSEGPKLPCISFKTCFWIK